MLQAPTSETKTETTQSKSQLMPMPERELHPHTFGAAGGYSVSGTGSGTSGCSPEAQRRQKLTGMQSAYGNQAVLRMMQGSPQVARMPALRPSQSMMLQRKCACGGSSEAEGECAECKAKHEGALQRRVANQGVSPAAANSVPPIVHDVLNSSGQPLDGGTRAFMEPRFGHDFSQVTVHTDARAAESARAVNALAYTVGRNVVFGTGQYAPGTSEGRRLMAHELTHVVQQGNGFMQFATKISQPEDEYEQEADRVAEGLMQPQTLERPHISRTTQGMVRRKPDKATVPIPQWGQLPSYAQTELANAGYDTNWFQDHSQTPDLRLTVLNLYVKLKGLGLWKFVGDEDGTKDGALMFISSDVHGLKDTLRERDDFSSPEESPENWSSREKKASNALHFKHLREWNWPETKVQAHIDPHGFYLRDKWWWLFPPAPLIQMLMHGFTQQHYQDVLEVRDILLGEGWDPIPLVGQGQVVEQGPPALTLDVEEQTGVHRTSAEQIATVLRNAIVGPGTDKNAIFNTLTGRTPEEVAEIKAAYKKLSGGETLEASLHGEWADLSRAFSLLQGESTPTQATPTLIALHLHEAIERFRANASSIIAILTGRSATELVQIRAEYTRLYGKSLRDSLQDKLSGKSLLEASILEREGLLQAEDEIKMAVAGLGTDEERLFAVLEELRGDQEKITQTMNRYATKGYGNMLEDLRGDLSGSDLDRAMELLLGTTISRNCSDEERKEGLLAISVAISRAEKAIEKLDADIAKGTLSSDIRDALERRFNPGNKANAVTIAIARQIQDRLSVALDDLLTRRDVSCGVVNPCVANPECRESIPAWTTLQPGDVVHLCPAFFSCSRDKGWPILHEFIHHTGVGDIAYVWQDKFPTLTPPATLYNPDSYAAFARDIE